MVACAHAVTAGNDPWIALRKLAPLSIRRRRFGHASGKVSSMFHPPPSYTNVTTTFGVRPERVVSSGSALPARSDGHPSKPISCAVVGARSAKVTRSSESEAATVPGATTTNGTRSRYIQALAWLVRGSSGTNDRDSSA